MHSEQQYLDSFFCGFSVDSLPIRDIYGKSFASKNFTTPHEISKEQFNQACKRFDCSEEILLMSAYSLLLARFAGADEVLFSATSTKKIPVAVTFSLDQNISDLIKNLSDQVNRLRDIIETPYEKIAEIYNFPNVPEFISTQQNTGDKTFALQIDENSCDISISFDGEKYSEALIESFAAAYKHVVAQFLSKEKISDIDWLSAADLAKVQNIHDTAWEVVERPAYRLLQDSALKFPERIAAIANGKSLTYRELNAAANRLGHLLQSHGVGVEKIVAVMLNRGLEVYIARQGILKAGGAFLPMTPDYPDDRVDYIVKDSNVRHIVTTRAIYDERKNFFNKLDVEIFFVEELGDSSEEDLNVAVAPDNLAYCIYTSGSTGKPKGVMLTNHNLVNFVDDNPKNHEILGYTERGKISLALAAITFDVSIMEEFIPLAHGLTICMANEEEIHNPLLLKELCDKNQVDLMSCTPSYLANLIDFPELASVVKRIKSVDFGAEAFPSALFTKLRAINPDIYIMNGYGPTEATISCTMKAIESAENITIGFPNSNVKVVMTDEKNRPLPIGALGEMTIIGDGIGRGYVNRDDLTKKVFIKLWDKPAYKSGDLARLLPNGEIAFHGRTDNQVKLRGLRVELGEIETVLNNFDGVKSSVVVVKKNSAGDYLAGYFTAEKQIDLDELKKHLAATLTAYMVPGVLMQLESFPLTANRKIDKKALPEPDEVVSTVEIVPPQNETQQKIFDCVAEVIGTNEFGIRTDFQSVGLTSIGAIRLNLVLSTTFNKTIQTRDIVEHDTIEKLEKFLATAQDVQTYETQADYPLTLMQKGIFSQCDAAPNETTYNLPLLLPLAPSIDIARLQQAVKAAINAHPYLKTKLFFNELGEVRARRHDDLPADVPIKNVDKLPAPKELVRPFALTEEPLYRVAIYLTPQKNYLFLDMHHLVYDGSSEDIFFDGINAAYGGQALSKETYTGFELALDEEKVRQSSAFTEAKKYYDELLSDCDVEVLPNVDFKAKDFTGVKFERHRTKIDADRVKNFCAENSCTLNTFFLAMFGYFLAKENRRADASFTTIYHGRKESRLVESVGMFVKTLPVLVDVTKSDTVKAYVDSVGRQLVESMAHDVYSFAEISAAYGFKGELMCVYQGEDFDTYNLAGTKAQSLPLIPSTAMSNLCLEIFLEDGVFDFRFEYRPNIYKAETVKKFAAACEEIAENFLTATTLEDFEITNHKVTKNKISVSSDMTAPQNETQQKIFDCVAEVIGTKKFGIRTDFQSVGLTSIGAIRLNVLLSRAFGKTIRTRDIKEHETIEKLEKFLTIAQDIQNYELQADYPLTQTQNGIFVECVANPNTTIYNIPYLYRLSKNVDIERLQAAIKSAIDAHPYLKATLTMNDNGDIRARRNDDCPAVVNIVQIDKLPPTEEIVLPYELLEKPLYRMTIYATPTENYLLFDFHHIICDGESFDIVVDDINAAYDGQALTEETYTGFELALDEEKTRKDGGLAKSKAHYDSIFRGCDADCNLFKDFDATSAAAVAYERGKLKISVDAVKDFCARNKVTFNAFFNAAFGFTLARFLCREDAIFTTVYNGRNDSRLAKSVSMLVKTLPVCCSIVGEKTVAEYVAAVGKQLMMSMANDSYSFAEISREYGIKADMMFVYQGEELESLQIAGASAEEIPLDLNQSKALFGMDVFIKDGTFFFETEYRPDVYNSSTVKNFVECVSQAAQEFLNKENLSDVDIVSAEELERLKNIHDTDWEVVERPAYRLLQDSAEKYPERIAAIANGKSLTYRELNAAANRLGHILQSHGVGVEKIVAVMLNRGLEVYIARQGILKAGGAFLPMTPDYPDDRVDYIVKDSNVRHIVTTRDIYDERKNFFNKLDVEIFFVEELDDSSEEDLNVAVAPDNLAYCIYTSGSTGKPKGVMLTNHNLVNFVDDNPKNHEILGYTERGKISLALAAITFDVSIMEEFIPLAHGLTVCMANEEEIHSPIALKKLCGENQIDFMICTPSYLANLIDFPELASVVKRIKSVDFGAEAFPSALFTKLRAINPDIYIMNGYGPTEATISCTMKAIESAENITIGFPNSNVKVVMTDEKNRPLPIGALGEMTIIGDGVGRGYVNRDDLTKKNFIRLWDKPAYKSGDLARLLPNGEIAFHGRTDNQVKLRGLRVELGEIETVLNNFDGVKSSVVVVKKDEAGDYLAGYFTAEKHINVDELKKHLAASLTAYMVPGVLMQLEKLPLTANGKVDKRNLPEPVLQVEKSDKKIAATELQQTLCEIFAKALGRKSIGADENFFEIGGTSLAASKVAMAAYLKKLPIVYADIFRYPTAEKLEDYILSQKVSTPAQVEKKIMPPKIFAPAKVAVKTFLDEVFQIERALEKNRVEFVDEIRHEGLGDVLLTGATGFLGIHILYDLLKNTSAKVFCFTRRGKTISAKERLKNIFIYYFDSSMDEIFEERVVAIEGDITNAESVDALMNYPFKTLINCAACVKHFAADDILTRINVEGVQNLINLCVKKKARLIQISTLSIAGDNVDHKISTGTKLAENDFYIGQEVTANKYVYSKFQAEEIVLAAVGQGILDAKIMRVGNLMSRVSDGEFQINFMTNAFMRDLRSYAVIGKFPVSLMDESTEFSPIDETAHMIVKLADTNADFTVFHVVNSHRVQMGDVIYAMNDYGIKIDVVPEKDFSAVLTEAMRDENKNLLVSNLIAYNESGNHIVEEIDYESFFTVKALYRLKCRWRITDDNYIRNAIQAIDTLGFFDEKRHM